jgi:hypothetical protein
LPDGVLELVRGLAEVVPRVEALIGGRARPDPELIQAISAIVDSGRELILHLDGQQIETAIAAELIRRFADLAGRLDDSDLLTSF